MLTYISLDYYLFLLIIITFSNKLRMQSHSIQILKSIADSQSFQQYLQITQDSIIKCIKQYFPLAHWSKIQEKVRDYNFYGVLKKLIEVYQNFTFFLKNIPKNDQSQSIGAQFKTKHQNTNINLDLQSRKNTRATFAMRNSKNQQQLKKDQIFVRVIPRTHNCIHFMVKNHNFPRIQCRLSCNQHLQYLVTYLTNKWLRGKVGVGYQIKLYPDPSTYMHKHSTEGKRPNIIHEPLNNYLMFTDIMAAFGVAQNGCINLLYDITQMRKQKQKIKVIVQKQSPIHNTYNNYQIRGQKVFQAREKFDKKMIQTPLKKEIRMDIQNSSQINIQYRSSFRNQYDSDQESHYKKYSKEINHRRPIQDQELKMHQNIRDMLDNQEQISIGMHRDRKSYIGNNSVDYSQVNSLGYHFNNGFSSNQLLGNLFNINNSNTFLNMYDNTQRINPIQSHGVEKKQPKHDQLINPQSKQNPNGNINIQFQPINQDKLESIRNIISFVEKEADHFGKSIDKNQELPQQKSFKDNEDNFCLPKIQKQKERQPSFKKQVKTVTIIKKKNNSTLFD